MRLKSVLAVFAAIVLTLAAQAQAEENADALATLAKATATVENLRQDEHFPDYWQPSLARARAVLIVPSFYKAGFFLGGAYGNGVLLVRNDDGLFSPPAFYRMVAGSLGVQVGAEEREIMYMIMSEAGLKAIMENRLKVGAGINLAIATWGGGAEVSTSTGAAVDIVAFSHAAGAFGGGAIEGARIDVRDDWNHALYGPKSAPNAIVFERRYHLREAEPLIAALMRASRQTPPAKQPEASGARAPGTVERQSLEDPMPSRDPSSSTDAPLRLTPQG